MELNGYDLSRRWFNFAFSNPEKISPNHAALYFFAIEHCNRLGWKDKFGLPTTMAKEAIGIRSYNTYIKTLTDLVNWGFIVLIERSKNQYSANIIALSNNDKALDKPKNPALSNNDKALDKPKNPALSNNDKALDKAIVKHVTKHALKQRESTGESISSIDKPLTINQEPLTNAVNGKDYHLLHFETLFKIEKTEILNEIGYARKKPVERKEVERFNGHLLIENKIHYEFHEYCKHLRNWLTTKPKEKNVAPKKEKEDYSQFQKKKV